ncbi:unnamed protein product [Onchocerca flexuosa]|nr:unnamed protein product [Onchocerca flexuosa]
MNRIKGGQRATLFAPTTRKAHRGAGILPAGKTERPKFSRVDGWVRHVVCACACVHVAGRDRPGVACLGEENDVDSVKNSMDEANGTVLVP